MLSSRKLRPALDLIPRHTTDWKRKLNSKRIREKDQDIQVEIL